MVGHITAGVRDPADDSPEETAYWEQKCMNRTLRWIKEFGPLLIARADNSHYYNIYHARGIQWEWTCTNCDGWNKCDSLEECKLACQAHFDTTGN